MLDHIRGDVLSTGESGAVISLGAIGVRVEMPTGDLAKLQGTVTVYTVMQIRDENVNLYGFSTERGRDLFKMLLTVEKVGPKNALAILSFHSIDSLERAIATGDEKALSAVSGIGPKTAGKIVIDLKDKVGTGAEIAKAPASSALGEVREALTGLGYSAQEIQTAVADLPADGDSPTLLRFALQKLGGKESTNGSKVR